MTSLKNPHSFGSRVINPILIHIETPCRRPVPIIRKGDATVIYIDKAGQIDKIDSQLSTKTHGSELVESFQFRD